MADIDGYYVELGPVGRVQTGDFAASGGTYAQEKIMAKNQYSSEEALRVVFLPFVDQVSGDLITAGDTVTLIVKKPDNSLLAPALVPTRDADTFFWIAEIPIADFQAGDWLIKADSNDPDTQSQFRIITWGDYVDDIGVTRQAALGRWKISGTVLTLYKDDGVTALKTYNLKDEVGDPSNSRIFERDPI